MDAAEALPARRLYGRARGKKLTPRQQGLIDALLPRLRVDDMAAGSPAALFPAPVSRFAVEIGFGGGEHIAALAERHRDVGFIGCEPFLNGVAKLLVSIEERSLDNVRIHDGEASALLDRLPQASLDTLYLLYPDPWPKARHNKRRFVSPENLARIARVVRPGGLFRFATDIPDYADWTLRRMAGRGDFIWTAERAEDWRRPWERWPGTRYEAKALAAGRRPAYFTFRRV